MGTQVKHLAPAPLVLLTLLAEFIGGKPVSDHVLTDSLESATGLLGSLHGHRFRFNMVVGGTY